MTSPAATLERPTEATSFDIAAIRAEFPLLHRTVHGDKRLVYLDNAATTQKPAAVIDAVSNYYRICNANVHRALHQVAAEATALYEAARADIAAFVGAPETETIVFTRGTTESINLVAHAWGDANLKPGDEILLSEMEHHSNLIPWQLLAARTGAHLEFIPVLDDGTLDLDAYRRLLSDKVKLVAVTHMSNLLGTINPVREMIADAHRAGALFLIDGAQSVPHMPVDVVDLDCDFLAFSGHKMVGPTGIGVLYARRELLESMQPFLGGGEMILKVDWHSATWAEVPHKFEAGTPNMAGAIGLGAAVRWLRQVGMDALQRHEAALTRHAIERLSEVPGLQIYGHAPERGGAISFSLDGIHPHDVAQFVDQEGVAIRAGHMCVQPLIRQLGHVALSRASFYLYNAEDDVEALVAALHKTREFFDHANG